MFVISFRIQMYSKISNYCFHPFLCKQDLGLDQFLRLRWHKRLVLNKTIFAWMPLYLNRFAKRTEYNECNEEQ
jgi:hypothetical protein